MAAEANEKKKYGTRTKTIFKRFLFAQNYILRGMTQSEALKAAGWSPKSFLEAHKALRDPRVRKYLAAILEEQQKQFLDIYRTTKENVINELAKIAFADPRRIVRIKDGKLQVVDSDQLDNIEAAAIAEIKETKKGLQIKFHSKVEALDKLAKILGLYIEKHEYAGKDGGPLRIILSQLNPEVFGGGNNPDA